MVRISPLSSMTMPDPSRSAPRLLTVRPSGLMVVLRRTTAESISSSDMLWALAGRLTKVRPATTNIAVAERARRPNGSSPGMGWLRRATQRPRI
jgi:hypothetical protein